MITAWIRVSQCWKDINFLIFAMFWRSKNADLEIEAICLSIYTKLSSQTPIFLAEVDEVIQERMSLSWVIWSVPALIELSVVIDRWRASRTNSSVQISLFNFSLFTHPPLFNILFLKSFADISDLNKAVQCINIKIHGLTLSQYVFHVGEKKLRVNK